MLLQRMVRHLDSLKSKKYEFYLLSSISFMVMLQLHHYSIQRESEAKSHLPTPIIYESRLQALNDQCNRSNIPYSNGDNCIPTNLLKIYPWLNGALFPVQSKSFLYCAIPKVASKTLISIVTYVYVRDILESLTDNLTNSILNRAHAEKLINIPKLTEQLIKNGIPVPHKHESNFVTSLLQTFMHILRYETVKNSSAPMYVNPWRLSLDHLFPNIQFKSLTNTSQIFLPSFTRALFVRHPFERLASAYKERIATLQKDRIQPEPHYDSIRKIICRRYAGFNQASQRFKNRHQCEDYIPSFEQFVRYILPTSKAPTDLIRMDGHWKPYTMMCQVCQLKYNFIGKYETFNDDFSNLLKRLNISDWQVKKRRGASGYTTQQYQQLYSSLPNDLICRLKDIYADDLQLFHYRIEDYINQTSLTC